MKKLAQSGADTVKAGHGIVLKYRTDGLKMCDLIYSYLRHLHGTNSVGKEDRTPSQVRGLQQLFTIFV